MMARPNKKQKILASHWYLDLTQELEKYPSQTKAVKESFDQLIQFAENIHPGAISVIESIQDALSSAAEAKTVQYVQASKLSLQQVIKLLGIEFVLGDPDYRWSLKDHQAVETSIQKIRRSKYFQKFQAESLIRTLFDILICDRLELLSDDSAAKHLKVVPEVQMEIPIEDNLKISGRADWTFGYMDEKHKLQEMLVVIEAKAPGNVTTALPQLLVYLAGVQDARLKINKTVFGLATDSNTFVLVVLQENKKVFASRQLDWLEEKELIISFLDKILEDAIESSPHTTPMRARNQRIKRFGKSLGETYQFGDEDNNDASNDHHGMWNVVEVNGVSLLQLCQDDDTVSS
ncbi:hypothetical protein V8E54_008261 [Elaphomyces granulatus]